MASQIAFWGGASEFALGFLTDDNELVNNGASDAFEAYMKLGLSQLLDAINGSKQSSGNPSQNIKGTSYDTNKLYKTQPDSFTSEGSSVKGLMDKISSEGPNSVEPIPVYVDNGNALIVDGHHRYQAFINLGYDRVPIKYIHQNQISSLYGRTLEELRYMMFK